MLPVCSAYYTYMLCLISSHQIVAIEQGSWMVITTCGDGGSCRDKTPIEAKEAREKDFVAPRQSTHPSDVSSSSRSLKLKGSNGICGNNIVVSKVVCIHGQADQRNGGNPTLEMAKTYPFSDEMLAHSLDPVQSQTVQHGAGPLHDAEHKDREDEPEIEGGNDHDDSDYSRAFKGGPDRHVPQHDR